MKNGWTGGQYSLYRGAASLCLLAHVAVPALNDSPLGMRALLVSGVAAAALLALGIADRIAAVAAAGVLTVLVARDPVLSSVWLPFIAWLLLVHVWLPPAPYGSRAARGRADPRGGWHFPPALFAAAWIAMSLAYAYRGYVALTGPSPADEATLFDVIRTALDLSYAPLALVPRLRPWIWLAMAVTHGLPVLHLLTFDPRWIPARWPARRDRIYYDGTCALCHGVVRFVLAEDRLDRPLSFAPLQESAAEIARGTALPDSLAVKTDEGEVLFKSRAVLYVAERLGGLWRVLATGARLVPRAVSDGVYDGLARVRYRLFGRAETLCPMLPPDLRARFASQPDAAAPIEG